MEVAAGLAPLPGRGDRLRTRLGPASPQPAAAPAPRVARSPDFVSVPWKRVAFRGRKSSHFPPCHGAGRVFLDLLMASGC